MPLGEKISLNKDAKEWYFLKNHYFVATDLLIFFQHALILLHVQGAPKNF